MRAWFALATVFAVGCTTTQPPVNQVTHARLDPSGYVTLPRLAVQLDLAYHGEEAGFVELSEPPDNVMLVRDSRRALVNGLAVPMRRPCMLRGDELVLAADDAETVRRALHASRRERDPAPPLVVWPLRRPEVLASSGLPQAWQPRPGTRVRAWKWIVIHHSVTAGGDAALLHVIHKRAGSDGLGYHFVVGNGTKTGDGAIEVGYRWRRQLHGAHARVRKGDDNRWNLHGIGICLIGDFTRTAPTRKQMDRLVRLVRALRAEYGIEAKDVVPHRFLKPTICPGPRFPWAEFQRRIR